MAGVFIFLDFWTALLKYFFLFYTYPRGSIVRCIAVDKEKAKYIKRAFEMYATGEYPLAQIRKTINSLGLVGKKGKMLSVSNYQYMLKNKIYYGMIKYNGELYDGNHERIRDFLKKIGSNFRIADRTLFLDFKNAFKIAEKYHAEALCAEASNLDFSKCNSWRRRRDSNPGYPFRHNAFRERPIQPL